MRQFVTLIEICVHLIRVNPGHICIIERIVFYLQIFRKSVEFCNEHEVWKLNVAHVLFMQVRMINTF